MPSWIVLSVVALLLFATGTKAKSLTGRLVWYGFGFMVLMGAVPAALKDPVVVITLITVAAVGVLLLIFKARKAAKKKEEEKNAPVHVHFYNRP